MATAPIRTSTSWQRILVVEPDPVRAEAICDAFAATDLVPDVAASAPEALEQFREGRHGVVVCGAGVGAPPLQALLGEDGRVTFVMLGALPADAVPGFEDRIASVLVDPSDPEELVDAVRRGLRMRRARSTAPALAALPTRVLLIEDDEDDAELVEGYMRAYAGWRVTHAFDLRTGLDRLQREPFDYVIADLTLPDARGVDAVLRVRSFAPDVPLVVLSGREDDAIALEALQAGANDYLLKAAVAGPALMRSLRNARERRVKEAGLRRAANEDPLTGLANRCRFQEALHECIARARRTGGELALLYLDLDGFKAVNDRLGHDAGDAVLIEVARRLRASLRETDVVARLGGDEFAVILEAVGSGDEALIAAERLLRVLPRPYGEHPAERAITASIGVARSACGEDQPAELIKAADVAMYAAKQRGRNTFEVARETARARGRRAELAAARTAGELRLHYQPQIAREGGGLAVEALLRWQRVDRLILPGEFLAELEATSEIVAVGAWVIDTACAQLAAWRGQGVPVERIAVNVSARQIDPALIEVVAGALARHGIEPGRLELEITESAVMQRLDQVVSVLGAVKALGVRLAMDDFGTGYSSLANLYRLPFDVVKLDRSLTADLGDPRARAALGAVVGLGRALGLEVVAEGVETAEQLAYLREQGCDWFQGFYLGRPVSPDQLAR